MFVWWSIGCTQGAVSSSQNRWRFYWRPGDEDACAMQTCGEAASFVCLLLKNICRNRITDRTMELFSLNRPEDEDACLPQTRRLKCVYIFHKDQHTMQQLLITPCDGVLQNSGFIFKTEHPFSRPYDEAASSPSDCHNVTDSTGCLFFWHHPENQPSLRPPNGNQYGALTGTLVAALVLLWQRSSCQCVNVCVVRTLALLWNPHCSDLTD